jgi:hypothetical protein
MPAAGFEAGISGMSRVGAWGVDSASAGAGATEASTAGFASVLVAVALAGSWAEAAVGGTGATAPAGSGAKVDNRQYVGIWGRMQWRSS